MIKNCIKREKFNTDENQGIKQVECFGNRILVLTNDNSLYMKGILYDMSNSLEYKKFIQFKCNILYFTMGINNCLLPLLALCTAFTNFLPKYFHLYHSFVLQHQIYQILYIHYDLLHILYYPLPEISNYLFPL